MRFQLTYPTTETPATRTYWVVHNALLAGAYPGQPDHAQHHARLQSLYDAGIRTFINLQEEGEANNAGQPFVPYEKDLREIAKKRGDTVAHLRFPIPDGGTTSADRMRSILNTIDLSLAANRAVYVHCFGGMGRTGTTICCWLMRHGHVDRSNVLATLTRLRKADKERADWKAPENADQESFVLNWAE
ncbi:protein-tyrosine phosphatase family protein [Allorhodopirellula heiligendammensis]|uniref:Dual specificity phosphatase, catalytic domain n=1 Tax=Allorhodopirellula heiligendammensis TaxID=2714739 RepID=A0A5C6C2G3_9BACT|nr:dual specificity protein phosphatase family protein [Allorhodopirellula heiligendammensis]TWU18750.1 Dual specificity phosphatase, catalytic domain [Allorhodopirellula heiligendammensis]